MLSFVTEEEKKPDMLPFAIGTSKFWECRVWVARSKKLRRKKRKLSSRFYPSPSDRLDALVSPSLKRKFEPTADVSGPTVPAWRFRGTLVDFIFRRRRHVACTDLLLFSSVLSLLAAQDRLSWRTLIVFFHLFGQKRAFPLEARYQQWAFSFWYLNVPSQYEFKRVTFYGQHEIPLNSLCLVIDCNGFSSCLK